MFCYGRYIVRILELRVDICGIVFGKERIKDDDLEGEREGIFRDIVKDFEECRVKEVKVEESLEKEILKNKIYRFKKYSFKYESKILCWRRVGECFLGLVLGR